MPRASLKLSLTRKGLFLVPQITLEDWL